MRKVDSANEITERKRIHKKILNIAVMECGNLKSTTMKNLKNDRLFFVTISDVNQGTFGDQIQCNEPYQNTGKISESSAQKDRNKLQQLHELMELTALINSSLDTSEIRKRAIEAATRLVDSATGSLLLLDQETGELFFKVALGEMGGRLKEIRLRKGQGIAGWVAEHGEPLIVNDVESDPRFFRGADEKSEFVTKNILCVPVQTKDKTLGVLQAINRREGSFSGEDREVLSALANQVAVAVENATLYGELKETFYGTASALAETIEKKDPYTGSHTKRVMDYSLAIGKAMGLDKTEMENLRLSAILHDIGKIGIRDSVLHKQDGLDDDEFKHIHKHAKYGAEILGHVKQLKDVIPGVKGHHERYDGTGYPDRIKGNDIPIAARIIAVADTFDAMTTDRPYRKGMSEDTALEELKKCSGTQFDEKVVAVFVELWKKRNNERVWIKTPASNLWQKRR